MAGKGRMLRVLVAWASKATAVLCLLRLLVKNHNALIPVDYFARGRVGMGLMNRGRDLAFPKSSNLLHDRDL